MISSSSSITIIIIITFSLSLLRGAGRYNHVRPEDQKKWLLMGQNIMLPNQTDLSFVFYDDDDDAVDGSLSSLLVSPQNGPSCFCDHCAHHQFKAPVRFLHYLKDFSEMSNLHFVFIWCLDTWSQQCFFTCTI